MPGPELKQHENGVWYVHWTEGRRSRRISAGTKEMAGPGGAKAFLGRWLLMDHEAAASPGTLFTVAELWALYDAKHAERNIEGKASFKNVWKNLGPHFGALKPAEITQETVDKYEARRRAGKIGRVSKPVTVRRELVMLRACLNWASKPKRKLLDKAALPDFDMPPESEPRDRWLSMEEVQRLLTSASECRKGPRLARGERFLWLALETAARKAAICELTWDRVDFETKVIHYNRPGRRLTKKRRASVPISKALLPILERAYRERENDLVLDNTSDPWQTVQVIAERASFGPRQDREVGERPHATGVSPHVLRHTAATHMARRGVPLWIIAKILGNSIVMVEKVYAKHCPDHLRDGIEMISGGVLEAAE